MKVFVIFTVKIIILRDRKFWKWKSKVKCSKERNDPLYYDSKNISEVAKLKIHYEILVYQFIRQYKHIIKQIKHWLFELFIGEPVAKRHSNILKLFKPGCFMRGDVCMLNYPKIQRRGIIRTIKTSPIWIYLYTNIYS